MPTYTYSTGPFNFGRLSDELIVAGVPVLTLRGTTTNVDIVCDTGSWSSAVAAVVASHDGTPTAPGSGTAGASAYEIAVDHGFVGSEAAWLASLVGSDGADGAAGATGGQGPQGNPGTNGTNGTNGSQGPAGPAPAGTGFVRVTSGVLDPVVGFGSGIGTICQGNDSRLSDARTPTAHTHNASDINAGVLGIARIPTGSTSSTACIGDDARLSNARAPTTLLSTGNAGPSAVGYSGGGAAVVQATSKAQGVTLSNLTGRITMNAAALAAATSVSFTVTNTLVAATDCVIVCIASAATTNTYSVTVDAVAAGSYRIHLRNLSAASRSEALVLNVVVVKGVAA